jgi:hypothetical protein
MGESIGVAEVSRPWVGPQRTVSDGEPSAILTSVQAPAVRPEGNPP